MEEESILPLQLQPQTMFNWTTSLEQRIAETEWLLHPSAGNESCCIFRVPQLYKDTNKKSYEPRIVSIGPYHHGKKHLKMMQQHKWRFLHDLLTRTPSTGSRLDDYLREVTSMEEVIRNCYSETLKFSNRELVEMMVLDGLFIIEVFCKIEKLSPMGNGDPIFNMAWVIIQLIQDLLLLENQIPFMVLQKLFDTSRSSRKDSNSTLAELSLKFFGNYELRIPYGNAQGRHFLDLLRLNFIPREMRLPSKPREDYEVQLCIQSATKLHLAGVKFKPRKARSFLDIKFSDGVLEIPEGHLLNLFNDVNEYQKNICHVRWAEFRFKYFDSPWSFLSALAAVILLIFTAIQAFFAVYAYLFPPESGK